MKFNFLGEEVEFTAWDAVKMLGAAVGFIVAVAVVFLIFG